MCVYIYLYIDIIFCIFRNYNLYYGYNMITTSKFGYVFITGYFYTGEYLLYLILTSITST